MSLLEGRIGLQHLEWAPADFYNLGYFEGRASRGAKPGTATAGAFDPAFRSRLNPALSFWQQCRVRGEFIHADRAEEALARRLATRSRRREEMGKR